MRLHSALVCVVLALTFACAFGQDSLLFELDPSDELSLKSNDLPIVVSFEYAAVSAPTLKFSMLNQNGGDKLEDRVSFSNGQFLFHNVDDSFDTSSSRYDQDSSSSDSSSSDSSSTSDSSSSSSSDSSNTFSSIDTSSSSSSSSSSPASRISVNFSILLCGALSLVLFRQNRKLAVSLFLLFVIYASYAQATETYVVVIQIPNGSTNLPDVITIKSPGGSMTSSIGSFGATSLSVDFCSGNTQSEVIMDNFDAASASLCATNVILQGTFVDNFQGTFEATQTLRMEASNRYAGSIQITSNNYVMDGDYCETSNDSGLYDCGAGSGLISLLAPDTTVILPSSIASPNPNASTSASASPSRSVNSISSVSSTPLASASRVVESPNGSSSTTPLASVSRVIESPNGSSSTTPTAESNTPVPSSGTSNTAAASNTQGVSSTSAASASSAASVSSVPSVSPSSSVAQSASSTKSESSSISKTASVTPSTTSSATPSSSVPVFRTSTPGEFLELVRTDEIRQTSGENPIVARSYDGHNWEPKPDEDYQPVAFTCESGACEILSEGSYEVRTVPVPDYLLDPSDEARWTRMMLQGTFGVTKQEIDDMVSNYGDDYAQWVLDQFEESPTYHRAYYRQRVNPRRVSGTDAGALFKPCEEGARYHRNAFNPMDNALEVVFDDQEIPGVITLRTDGVLRTEIDPIDMFVHSETYPATFTICLTADAVGGIMLLDDGSNLCQFLLLNPTIEFSSIDSNTQVLTTAEASFVPVNGVIDAIVLDQISVPCTIPSTNSYIQYDGDLYRFDPRIKLLENSLAAPVDVQAEGTLTCPAVVQTFLNEDYCVERPSCSPLEFSSTLFELDETVMRVWYEEDRIYVYEIRDLTLESPYDVSPCSGVSRWQISADPCVLPTNLEPTTLATFETALRDSVDPNPFVRDIVLQGIDCIPDDTIGASITVDGQCFTHVNPQLFNLLDFTYWTSAHPGNVFAAEGGRPNPITRWAEQGFTYLEYPSHHSMERFSMEEFNLPYVGRLGDIIPFDSLDTTLQTVAMATLVGANSQASSQGFLACGSPAEFASNPRLGDRYQLSDSVISIQRAVLLDNLYNSYRAKTNVWFNAVMISKDHLRQRVAWALYQTVPIAEGGAGFSEYTETYASYQDIFIRNAFGNYRDILRETAHHYMMSRYLSFDGNRAYAVSLTYPDENFAREIMQLFSIGLWQLNDDGSRVLDGEGNPIATYTNDDILDFARLWTGFDRQPRRSNTEETGNDRNGIDPLLIKGDVRDFLPKAKLDSGYLGDRYPICHELPAQHWLKIGAQYDFTGDSSIEGELMDAQDPLDTGLVGRFTPSPTSELYQVLCVPDGATGECTFPLNVVLDTNLACEDMECDLATVTTVAIYDAVADVTKYYYYTMIPCADLTFFDDGVLTATNRNNYQCANPSQAVASPICCNSNQLENPVIDISDQTCLITKEVMDFDTAATRCVDAGLEMCHLTWSSNWSNSCSDGGFLWLADQPCTLKVQIFESGQMNIVDETSANNWYRDFRIIQESSFNVFRVRWENGAYPLSTEGCSAGCEVIPTVLGDSCLCDISVTESTVFTDIDSLPSVSEVLDSLFQGALEPFIYESTYALCNTCTVPDGYSIWVTTPGVIDSDTIFEVAPQLAGGKTMFLFNRESVTSVGDGEFLFRNPPRFMPGPGELTYRTYEWNSNNYLDTRAERETEDLLDHLFEHPNTAPFIVYRLIQRLVTSNPSPRYISVAVEAFRTGTYNGVEYSGKYGDIGAAVAAILLDEEARTPMLEVDPTFGVLKEPMVRILQVMKALEYTPVNTRELIVSTSFVDKFGMQPYHQPSVFGFYLPEFRPEGPISNTGIVSPESQLNISPFLFGLLNSFMELADNGLTPCSFGNGWRCTDIEGTMEFQPSDINNAQSTVDELDLLLTAQRINPTFKQHIVDTYEAMLISDSAELAFKHAQKLILLSPEFHVSNNHQSPDEEPREEVAGITSQNRPYKAIIVVIEDGGADSYNKIVPLSDCGAHDLNAEYIDVRDGAAIDNNDLWPIDVPVGSQPCDTFGIHPAYTTLKESYDLGEGLFFSNVGALVEPITKEDYNARPIVKQLPPSLFAHNIMSRSTQNLHPQNAAATGVLGRAVVSLREQSYRSQLYSLMGTVKLCDGGDPDFVTTGGITQFKQYEELIDDINTMAALVSDSPMAESYLSVLTTALNRTETIGTLVDDVVLNETFSTNYFSRQLEQVAKLIHAREDLQTERDVFVVRSGGFDTHATFNLDDLFEPINEGLTTFTAEMKSIALWDSIAVLSISEFGRTLTSNGAGTDHGWGGNHFLIGGAVNGKQILGDYPDRLTEDGDVHIGRGRLLPTTSWDAVWNGLMEWFDVEEAQMETVLPNRSNFPSEDLFSANDLFV